MSISLQPSLVSGFIGLAADRVEGDLPKMAYGFGCRTHRCFGAMSTLPAPRLL